MPASAYNEASRLPNNTRHMKRILIVKTSSMGDVIHALPVLHDLKVFNPFLEVDWMVEAPFVELVQANAHVNRVIPVHVRQWRKLGVRHLHQQWRLLKEQLADQPYDVVLDLQGLLKSALLSCAARGVRMGPGFAYAKEGLAALFYAKRSGWDPQAHAVERLRELAAGLFDYHLEGPPVFYGLTPAKKTPSIPLGAEVWFLHATARAEKKWPLDHWRTLAQQFLALGYVVKLPWGSEAEQQQALQIAEGLDHVEVLPRMGLGEMKVRMQQAKLVIGVDTGLMHLAAALYLPLVALFFATPAWRFAPKFNPHSISLGDVGRLPSVYEVFEAANRLIRGNKL